MLKVILNIDFGFKKLIKKWFQPHHKASDK
jgi:hypothetical protein